MIVPKNKTIIAGPCSAESSDQVMETARQIHAIDPAIIYRAGIWKPRTKPGSFEGVGSIGLSWLQEVKNTYGLKTATEVANPAHVEACLEHDIDILWIGARTTVNPFSVQAIADALRGSDKTIMVKNPIHADIQLWVGAFERLDKAGIKNTVGIHRGFHSGNNGILRNEPNWSALDQFSEMLPEKKIICDPSHIAGDSLLVPSISEMAMKRSMHGLMIETHRDPSVALSDKHQQLRPNQLVALLDYLFGTSQDLIELREEIDQTDEHLISLLARRMSIAQKIALSKRRDQLEIIQPDRWANVRSRNEKLADRHKLDPLFIDGLYEMIHEASIDQQKRLL
jgi:chorismate mutase